MKSFRSRGETISELSLRLERKLSLEFGGALLALIAEPAVVDILLNDDGAVWVERLGAPMCRTDLVIGPGRAASLLCTVASVLGTVVNDESPIVEGELPFEGARFEGVLPPVSRGPIFAIRKRATELHGLDDYVRAGTLDARDAEALREAIENRLNIVVCGGAGTGKTTFANALLQEKLRLGGTHQRIVILEDTPELQCAGENAVWLRTTPSADLAALVRTTLRLRPDAIVIGEVRGREALELLKAWLTGHPGGIATVHASNARAALPRLDQLLQEAGVPSQPTLVAAAVDVVVCMTRDGDGRRVKEVLGVDEYDAAVSTYLTHPMTPQARREEA
jgi:type IV secretion system protein VirB11